MKFKAPPCHNRLIVTSDKPDEHILTEAIRLFKQHDGSPKPLDFRILAPLSSPGNMGDSAHSCRNWIDHWGTHYAKPKSIRQTVKHGRFQQDFITRVFPADGVAKALSLRFPQLTFEIRFASKWANVSGRVCYKNGVALKDEAATGITPKHWESVGGDPAKYVRQARDSWVEYALRRPSPAAIGWLDRLNFDYHEEYALSSMMLPEVRHLLRETADARRRRAQGMQEVTAAALGLRIPVHRFMDNQMVEEESRKSCMDLDEPVRTRCMALPNRHSASAEQALKLDMHAVNYLRAKATTFDKSWRSFESLSGTTTEKGIISLRVLYEISLEYPQYAKACAMMMKGIPVH